MASPVHLDEQPTRRAPRRGIVDRLDAFQRRHPVIGFPVAVVYKFVDDQGVYLAALITYYGFLSLFPLLLLVASVTGFVLEGDTDLQRQVVESTVGQFPVIREEIANPKGLQGSTAAVIVGAVIALYGALGVAQAIQNMMNTAWAVPRNHRPNPIRARARSLLLIMTAGLTVVATTVLSAMVSSAETYGADVSRSIRVVATVAAVLLNAIVALIGFRVATARPLRKRDVLPGALIAAVLWQVLQLIGTAFVGYLRGSSTTYGVFSAVFGLLAWLFLAANSLVLCVELNVVRAKRLYPRALLTVFTDDVDLTDADMRIYADAAGAQRLKGFETVTVSYDHDGQQKSAVSAGLDGEPAAPAGRAAELGSAPAEPVSPLSSSAAAPAEPAPAEARASDVPVPAARVEE